MSVPLSPGRPGRGYDPTAAFTDMQWYMYHQRNVAFFAAFSTEDIDSRQALDMARELFRAAPHFAAGSEMAGGVPGGEVLARLIRVETVEDFDGFPECRVGDGLDVFDAPGLPLVRIRVARRRDGPDGSGRRSFLLVLVAHALTEGSDSALLSRSHSAAHLQAELPPASPPAWVAAPARVLGMLAALMHLLVSRIWTPHPGPIRVVTRVCPRALISDWAHDLGVSQRALCLALGAHVINGAGTTRRRRRISCTYSTLRADGAARGDPFMRMRMLFARFDDRPDFPALAREVHAVLAHEHAGTGFNAALNAAAIATHRWLAARIPRAYGPKVFAFMPYDLVFGLLPPHRLGGPLAGHLSEPVYAGAVLPGVNACVVVPGRRFLTLGFYVEEALVAAVGRLDELISARRAEVGPPP